MRTHTIRFAPLLAFAVIYSIPAAFAQGAAPAKPALPDAPKPQSPSASPAPAPAPPAVISPFKDEREQSSYAVGLVVGRSLKRQNIDLDVAQLDLGIKDGLSGGKVLLTDDQLKAAMTQMQIETKARQEEAAKLAASKNRSEGEAFLDANKSKPGVVVLPSGLQYKVLTQGTGPKPAATDTVVCNYRGTLIDGTEFDSSYKRGKPATFPVGRVIRGWTEALQLMPVGSKWQLFIPSALAYGERAAGSVIGPDSTLIFDVELISIEGKLPPPPAPKD